MLHGIRSAGRDYFLGLRHLSRTERRTSCRPPEYNHSDQIDVTWIFSLSAFLASLRRLYQRCRLTATVFLFPLDIPNQCLTSILSAVSGCASSLHFSNCAWALMTVRRA